MNVPASVSLFHFDFFIPLPIQIERLDAPLTSDGGLLPLLQFDDHIGLTAQFAAALHDPRDPELIEHTFLEMVRSRVFGILAGYAEQNDQDTLRTGPVFQLIAGRSPEEDDLASQPTLSRFENQIDIASLKRLRQVFVDQFIASFADPPLSLTFDLDAVDDPTHGSQQLTLFHGFHEQYQYLPLVVTSADNDQVVMISLPHGTMAASLGADDDLEYLVTRVRADWPNVSRASGIEAVPGSVPLRGGEGGGQRAGDEPRLRGDQSRRCVRYAEATYSRYVMRGETCSRTCPSVSLRRSTPRRTSPR